jgi:hypothetical protein
MSKPTNVDDNSQGLSHGSGVARNRTYAGSDHLLKAPTYAK